MFSLCGGVGRQVTGGSLKIPCPERVVALQGCGSLLPGGCGCAEVEVGRLIQGAPVGFSPSPTTC